MVQANNTSAILNVLTRLLPSLSPEERAELERLASSSGSLWTPLPGPQTAARDTKAFETLFGGAAGGGKSDCLLGLAINHHRQSIIFRREYTQLTGMIHRSKEILTDAVAKFNANDAIWKFNDGRMIEFGAVKESGDWVKFKGRPHDGMFFDELTEFQEQQYLGLILWARTTVPGQRVRIFSASNPPPTAEGEWVLRRWSPWLDRQHPRPAAAGELRWFATIDGEDREVEDEKPVSWRGSLIHPRSRTFIPSRLDDNPYLARTDYRVTLQNAPGPLSAQLLYGDWTTTAEDDQWQVIPTSWVREAMERWKGRVQPVGQMTALGVDVARGGKDKTVLSRRWATWFAPLEKKQGVATPSGTEVAGLVLTALVYGGGAIIDVTGGYGGAVMDVLRMQDVKPSVRGVNFSAKAPEGARDKSGKLNFRNARAYGYWKLREALDPETGDNLALPPDPELLADLTAPKWKITTGGIQVESKEEIAARLGRSPDCGDAVMLAWAFKPVSADRPKIMPQVYSALRRGAALGRWR